MPPSIGLLTLRGKSLDPLAAGGAQFEVTGVHAGGAGNGLFPGAHVIATGGVVGYEGCGGAGLGGVTAGFFIPPVPQAVVRMQTPASTILGMDLLSFPVNSGAAANTFITTHLGTVQYGNADHNERVGDRQTAGFRNTTVDSMYKDH
ncbi:MAG TPA: hypothetical protein VGS27_27320 [Candidatus Sulfotelmatobacter sp.]|nr:hypothetical protein [Candidatus Sulfotelmatobacter sp.]